MAAIARAEHDAMGGALIDEGGGLIRAGFAEAERDRAPGTDLPTWQRVWDYWVSAGIALPVGADASVAEQRVALIDHPWSAVFISHVMRLAGLDEAQFRMSATHQSYVRAALASNSAEAFGAPTRYAYRACDVRDTPARVGDLLCTTRAPDDAIDTFDDLAQTLVWRSASMHCDLVVGRDAARIEAIGGNVVQTVTLRRLSLAADGSGLLWPAYLASAHRQQAERLAAPASEGAAQALLPDTRLNQQPWSVLLQLRQVRGASVPDAGAMSPGL